MEITDQEFREFGMRTSRPVPGQSLTHNPETPQPYEGPPEFTDKQEALEHFLEMFMEEKRYNAILDSLKEGTPVMDLVQIFLTKSFQEGEINPDLMMLLAEPLAYILLALAERAGIQAIIVDDPDDPDEETTNDILRSQLQTITNPQDDEETPMKEKIEDLPSLMAREKQ